VQAAKELIMDWQAKLKSIHWEAYHTNPRRSVGDLPLLLHQLAQTSDILEQESLIDELDVYVKDYRQVYRETPSVKHAVIPVISSLLEMLKDEKVPSRRQIMWYLPNFFLDKQAFIKVGMKPPSEDVIEPIQKLLQSGLSSYISLLSSEKDMEFRSFIIWFLTHGRYFSDIQIPIILDAVCNIIATDNDSDIRISAIIAVGAVFLHYKDVLVEKKGKYLELVIPFTQKDSPYKRFVGIYAAAAIYGEDLPEDIEKLIIEELLAPSDSEDKALKELVENKKIPDINWLTGKLPKKQRLSPYHNTGYWYAAQIISEFNTEKFLQVFERLIESTQYTSRARQFALTMLDKVFKLQMPRSFLAPHYLEQRKIIDDGSMKIVYSVAIREPKDPSDLSAAQKQALRIVLKTPKLWEIPNNLLERYGLSISTEELTNVLIFS
jgi:hypothetical protein